MKKVLTLLAAALIAVSAHAQFGVVAGLTSSSTDYKSALADLQTKNINQYHVGITYKIGLGMLAVQPSLIYNMKGQSLEAVKNVADAQLDYKTGFLELPVQIQAGINLLDIVRVYGIAEPFVGYAITNGVKLGGKDVDLKDQWANVKNKLEYGVGLGVGAEVLKHLQVSVRYFWNLGDVYGSDINFGGISKTVTESKCNGVSASVAFLF